MIESMSLNDYMRRFAEKGYGNLRIAERNGEWFATVDLLGSDCFEGSVHTGPTPNAAVRRLLRFVEAKSG
jgi:hypothetical protein